MKNFKDEKQNNRQRQRGKIRNAIPKPLQVNWQK
jgi:hypothetical protein